MARAAGKHLLSGHGAGREDGQGDGDGDRNLSKRFVSRSGIMPNASMCVTRNGIAIAESLTRERRHM